MPRYRFTAEGTISLHLTVEAETLKEARAVADEAGMQSFCHQCSNGHDNEWSTSGELDCEPANIRFDGQEDAGEEGSK